MNKILLSILLCFFTATYTFAQNPCECTFKKKAPKGTPFHLYNTATEIVVLSYKEAYDTMWLINSNEPNEKSFHIASSQVGVSVKDNNYVIPESLDSIVLKAAHKDQLFKILHLYQQKGECISNVATCYEPHHLILFYQQQKMVAFLEVCFLCLETRSNKKELEYLFDCDKKYDLLKQFFKEIGVKNHLAVE